MTKKDILELFYQTNADLSAKRIILLMLVGIVIGAVIFITYKLTYKGVSYSFKFNISNVIILLITIVIMIMISSNIVVAMGMVGALSIIRFRTAIKDPRDTVFIFWAVVEGLSIGSQSLKLTGISTCVIAVVLIIASFVTSRGKYIVVVRGNAAMQETPIFDILKKCGKKVQLRGCNRTEQDCEFIFEYLSDKKANDSASLEIQKIAEVKTVNILLETGETIN